MDKLVILKIAKALTAKINRVTFSKINDVPSADFAHLKGITGGIQTQINALKDKVAEIQQTAAEKIEEARQDALQEVNKLMTKISQTTATSATVLAGRKFVDMHGELKTGTIVDRSRDAVDWTLGCDAAVDIQAGFYDTTFTIVAKDLPSQTPGNATPNDILIGKSAWVDGVRKVGGIPVFDDQHSNFYPPLVSNCNLLDVLGIRGKYIDWNAQLIMASDVEIPPQLVSFESVLLGGEVRGVAGRHSSEKMIFNDIALAPTYIIRIKASEARGEHAIPIDTINTNGEFYVLHTGSSKTRVYRVFKDANVTTVINELVDFKGTVLKGTGNPIGVDRGNFQLDCVSMTSKYTQLILHFNILGDYNYEFAGAANFYGIEYFVNFDYVSDTTGFGSDFLEYRRVNIIIDLY